MPPDATATQTADTTAAATSAASTAAATAAATTATTTAAATTQAATATAAASATPAWYETVADADKETAKRYDSLASMAKGVNDMRKQLSTSIRIPGKDAKPEELAEYRTKLGVPTKIEEYEIPKPAHLDDAAFGSEVMKTSLTKFATKAHELNVNKDQLKGLLGAYWEMDAANREQLIALDKQQVEATEAQLKKEWPGADYDRNKTAANRAAQHFFGDAFEQAKTLETKSGRFLLDHPDIVKVFAKIGREMGEDRLGPTLTETDVQTNNQKINDLTRQIADAHNSGDRSNAKRLDQERMALIQKTRGNGSIVGAQGRAA